MSALLWALLAVPLLSGALLAIAGRRTGPTIPALAVAASTLTLVLGCLAAALHPAASAPLLAGIDASVRVDGLSAVLVVLVTAVTTAVLVFSVGEFDRSENRGRFFGLMLVFAGAMLLTVTATNLAPLLMGWEAMGALSYALIGFWWQQPARVAAAGTAFLTTRAADLGLYLAAGAAVAGGVPGLALAALPGAAAPWHGVLTAGIIVAAAGKSAQLPFSFWLARAMEGPSPVSALLHSATMVAAGAYLLLRVHPLLVTSGWAGPAVAWLGAATALVLGLVAVAQRDLKQLLAASTSAQLGFMFLAAGAGGIAGGTDQLIAHAATKSLLFLAAGAWLTALGTKALPALRGAGRAYPLVGVTFTVGALSLAGLPPLSLWVSKDELLAAALERSPALYAVGLAAAVVSAVYSIKAVVLLWQPLPADAASSYDTERTGTRRTALVGRPVLVTLATAAAVLGLLALPAVSRPLAGALRAGHEPSPHLWELALSAALAAGAAVLTWRWGQRPAPLPAPVLAALRRWLGLERAAQLLIAGPTLAAAARLAWFDDHIVDGAVHQLARGTVQLAAAARRGDDRGLDHAVGGLARSTGRLGRLARRPQTGQLHQYYAQATVALVVLVLLIAFVR